jgi:lipopolysaccharide/colanic/teichoic acid biosynthesis glycosyltransferase
LRLGVGPRGPVERQPVVALPRRHARPARTSRTAPTSTSSALRYVENWSVSLDVMILWKAVTGTADETQAY